MALTARQTAFYNDTVDVYSRPAPATRGAGSLWIGDLSYSTAAAQTAVPCMWQSEPENNRYVPPAGRAEMDILFTLDRFFFEASVSIEDGDALKVTTSGHPENGRWFQVMGKGRARINRGLRRGNYQMVYAKRVDERPQA